MQVKITQVAPNRWIVAREFGNKSAAVAGANRLLDVEEAGFAPIPPILDAGPAIDPPEGVLPPSVAAAYMRDAVPPDDDEGESIPGYRCANGACVGD